jgi:hypothetical protein
MNRPVESRRRLLKALAAAGGAVTTATVLPDAWKKPLINSVVVPLHAQASAPSFITTIQFAYVVTGPEGVSGTLTPSNTPETHAFNTDLLSVHNFAITPTVVVDPSIADAFNLTVNETAVGGDSTNFFPATQNLTPNAVNGVIPFNVVNASVDNARFLSYQITLTPDNPIYPTYFLEITFDEDPPGSGAP